MNLSNMFSKEEKKEFLVKNGYTLVEHKELYWDQWGNHDSQGKWETQTYLCAVKGDDKPSKFNLYDKVFEWNINHKFKEFILRTL